MQTNSVKFSVWNKKCWINLFLFIAMIYIPKQWTKLSKNGITKGFFFPTFHCCFCQLPCSVNIPPSLVHCLLKWSSLKTKKKFQTHKPMAKYTRSYRSPPNFVHIQNGGMEWNTDVERYDISENVCNLKLLRGFHTSIIHAFRIWE